ncbi:MAG: adenylate/guanylate cyclase domain-containing protein [Solirubrobacterales bacterium]
MERPKTRYARSGELSIAYQVVGDGPIDLVHIPGLVSHIDAAWSYPKYVRFMRHLSSFARVAVYDKRGCGLSDAISEPPTIEERIDDARAVMDAAGMDHAAVFGCSEGATLGAYFAASYPDRVDAAILYGSFARMQPDPPDYPWGYDAETIAVMTEGALEAWGEGIMLTLLAPSLLHDEREREWWGGYGRASMSPGALLKLSAANLTLDIRDILGSIRVPTLLLHRTGDVNPIEGARYIAEWIPNAQLVELEGDDHWPWVGDPDQVCDHVEEFLTGRRHTPDPDRVLATVLFTDIVSSTARAAELGDRRWTELLGEHEDVVRRELERHRGREVKTIGDGFLATFDGPARAIRCATAATDELRRLGVPIRAGVHTGECELRNGDVGGIAVHIGARVMAAAGEGEVLVSSTVRDLTVGSDIEFADRGTHELKGVPGEWRLFAVAA